MTHVLETLQSLYGDKPPGGLALLATISWIKRNPVWVHTNLCLRRATQEEGLIFRDVLDYHRVISPRNPYETRSHHTEMAEGTVWMQYSPLDPSEYRYHVIEFQGSNHCIYFLRQASVLTRRELYLGVDILHNIGGIHVTSGQGVDTENTKEELWWDDATFQGLTGADLNDLIRAYEGLAIHDESIVPLQAATSDYLALRKVSSQHSNLRFLGMFALLESLLTHQPSPKDPYDSITRQVTQKTLLLESRFRLRLPYEACFGPLRHEKAWSALYALRSCVAHGGKPEFTKGPLQALRSLENAETFIRAALRAVMRQALEEPQLLADLRNC